MKTKYIIVLALIAVYILIQTSDEKKTGVGAGITTEQLLALGYGGGTGEAVSRRQSTRKPEDGVFTTTTNILFDNLTIWIILGVAIYLLGGFGFLLENPTLLLFTIMAFGVMAWWKG